MKLFFILSFLKDGLFAKQMFSKNRHTASLTLFSFNSELANFFPFRFKPVLNINEATSHFHYYKTILWIDIFSYKYVNIIYTWFMGNLVIFNIDKKCPSPDKEEERGGERILFINKRLVSPVLLCKD